MEENKNVQVLLILGEDESKRFYRLKKQRGLKNSVELVRQVLKEVCDRELKEGV